VLRVGVTVDGVWIVTRVIEHLYTLLGTASNYERHLQSSHFTVHFYTHHWCPQSVIISSSRFLVTASNSGNSSASALTPMPTGHHLTTELWQVKVKVTLRLTVSQSVSQSVSLGVEPNLGLMTRYLLLFDSYGLVFYGAPLWREDGSIFCTCY
jgi:hypothetical protein